MGEGHGVVPGVAVSSSVMVPVAEVVPAVPFPEACGALGGFLKGYHEGLRVLHQGIAGGLDGDDPDGVPTWIARVPVTAV